jgi:hypothetical protein
MKNYVVFVPTEKRNDNPYINSDGYLINPSNNELLIYNLTHAKDKAQLFGGSHHLVYDNKKPDLTFYSDYIIKDKKLYISHETEDNRVHTTLLDKLRSSKIDRVKEFYDLNDKIIIIL